VNPDPISGHAKAHLEKIRGHYDQSGELTKAAIDYRQMLAAVYSRFIPESASVLEIGCGAGDLLVHLHRQRRTGVDVSAAKIQAAQQKMPEAEFFVQAGEELALPGRSFDYLILSETINLAADVQRLFERLRLVSHRGTRLIINIHSALWRPMIWAGTALGLRNRQPESNWLSKEDIGGWELIRHEPRILCPVKLLGLEHVLNRWLAPLLPSLCFSVFSVARVAAGVSRTEKTVSVVVPARNESGNIQAVLERTPEMGIWTECIFVEGNSQDDTWDEMQRVKKLHPHKRIKFLRESGRGKAGAVRDGFAVAEGELLMILDADLTMPPEELPKFYEALVSGRCDFANGSRLVYPMEGKAMRFLNLCANKAFSILFSWLLGQPVKDTLCGTKALTRTNYQRIAASRAYFGEFDPFGDFDLLFGASKLNLKILDIPIRYRERVYGQTNIHRWRHGWLLLRMVAFAALKLKFV
jgi:SAM-dependent methyltransferase